LYRDIPLKVLEYLSCGRPAFANMRSTMISEIVDEKVAFRFDHMEEMAEELRELSKDKESTKNFQQLSRMVAECYGWSKLSDKLKRTLLERWIIQ